jgi:trimethylamine:corrinoid methyltransferase-like protein
MASRMARGIEITPETLMGEAIERVGVGGDYLREKETRRRVRAGEHFVPRIGSRLPFEQWIAEGRTEADAADDVVRAALAAREERGPRLTDGQRLALAEVCDMPSATK